MKKPFSLISTFCVISLHSVFAIGSLSSPALNQFNNPENIFLRIGEKKNFPLTSSTVWIENSKILKAQTIGTNIRLQGLNEGESAVQIGENSYLIQVIHPRTLSKKKIIQDYLKKFPQLEMEFQKGRLKITGILHQLEEWEELKKMSDLEHIKYTLFATLSDDLQNKAQAHLNSFLRTQGLKEQILLFSDTPKVFISSQENLDLYKEALLPYGIQVQQNKNSIETDPSIKVQIFITEIKKEFSRQYGLQTPTSYSASFLKGQWTEEELNFNLKALESAGNAKILARPNLICKSGKEAEFMAGGEFPIKISNFKMNNVIWKSYGILLKIKPIADLSGRMSISLNTEISNIDSSKNIDGIPGLFTNKVSSHFDLLKSQPIVLSGLIQSESSQSQNGLAWLMNIPVLGPLFSSQDFRENRSELLIIVYPSLIKTHLPLNTDEQGKLHEHGTL